MGRFLVELGLWFLFIEAMLYLYDRPKVKEIGETMVYKPFIEGCEDGKEPDFEGLLPWRCPRIYLLQEGNNYTHERWDGWHDLAWRKHFYCDDMSRTFNHIRRNCI